MTQPITLRNVTNVTGPYHSKKYQFDTGVRKFYTLLGPSGCGKNTISGRCCFTMH